MSWLLAFSLWFIFCDLLLGYEFNSNLLDRNVSSHNILSRDINGNCFIPPFCDLNINECNIPRISINDITSKQFKSEYFEQKKPVIIQLCSDNDKDSCDLSQLINNETGIFTWENIISKVRSKHDYNNLINLEMFGTPKDRAKTIDIHPLKDREPNIYGDIINNIKPLPFLDDIDIYNDLVGYLSTSDEELIGNKWVIFGTTGGGAHFHFDYYLTSFWNAVLSGSKYWVMIPPYDVLNIWNNSDENIKEVMNLSINDFFAYKYINGYIKDEINKKHDNNIKLYNCIQNKGDILYAPAIYYHATVNLAKTLSVSRNMITRVNYQQSFGFMTQPISLKSKDPTRDNKWVGIYQTINMCCALYKYDNIMFQNSGCWSKQFLNDLNSMDIIHNNVPLTHENLRYNSQYYVKMCNWVKEHPFHSSFRL